MPGRTRAMYGATKRRGEQRQGETTKEKLMITVDQYLKNEWARFAQAAYAMGKNSVGHRYSAAASIPNGTRLPVQRFDELQRAYRAWLAFNECPAE
ncbi:hypothetical protein Q3C01_05400 [Bradyrhizobium sp. UFLA05-109]